MEWKRIPVQHRCDAREYQTVIHNTYVNNSFEQECER